MLNKLLYPYHKSGARWKAITDAISLELPTTICFQFIRQRREVFNICLKFWMRCFLACMILTNICELKGISLPPSRSHTHTQAHGALSLKCALSPSL